MHADIDTALLDRVFQPVADRAASAATCFDLARFALAAAVALQTIVLIDDLLTFGDPVARALAGGITLLAFVGADQGRRLIVRVERQARSGMMNVRRITLRSQRWAWLAICGWTVATTVIRLDATSLHLGLASLAWVATIYFASCTPQPPRLVRHHADPATRQPGLSRCHA